MTWPELLGWLASGLVTALLLWWARALWQVWRALQGEAKMSGADFKAGMKTGMADADVTVGASPGGVKAEANLAVQPELRDLLAAGGGMAISALTGPWGPAILIAAGAGLYFYRKQKGKGAGA